MKNKLDSLQIIRAIAACFVVIDHLWQESIVPQFILDFGSFGVDLFFVLSGFIMCLTVSLNEGSKLKNAIYFLKKRVVRIFPIYLFCALPLIILVARLDGINNIFFYLGNILLLPSFVNDSEYRMALPPGWSLVYEMFFYYIFTTYLLVFGNKKKLSFALIFTLVALVGLVHLAGIQGSRLGWVNLSYMIGDSILINFAAGMLSYFIYMRYKEKINIKSHFGVMLLIVICALSILLSQYNQPKLIARGIPAFLIIIVFLFTRFDSSNSWVKKAVFIGDASYSIYLSHYYFTFLKTKILMVFSNSIIDRYLLVNIVSAVLFVIAIIVGCYCYLYVEKPMIKYFSRYTVKANKVYL